ncbi:serine/threonine-protein kinase S6KL isoform X1 [Neodiprion pinetum]|uniref:serine/threonine-protein kinase S6KL isoform X1 n=1 Tax=Neodiprion pinetum TaxID=441929 RepID=UPI001EE03723|nr:serine/threonine-protein kinase S6KL isoform X4 [Neodiprion pinetum]
MGNCVDKTKKYTAENARQEPQVAYASYSSLDNVLSRRSSRFALFSGSSAGNSTTSAHVEWSRRSRASRISRISRISRRTGSQDTPEDPCSLSKTRWPVPQFEAAFLPEFKIKETAYKTNYDIIDLISKGAYGQVYKVRSRIDGEIFALKVLNKAQIIAEDAIERVKDEVRIQQVVGHHPFVVNASRYWQDKRRLYVGSDYVSGGELFTLVEGYGNLPEDAVRILVAEVALAIDFLHNAGIIHRDVKASNVLLDEEGHAQLIDFGFAKWLKHGQKTSTLCGTPQYIAPEILRGEPYGHAIDWWSLGVLMYFLLTSEMVYGRRLRLEYVRQVVLNGTRRPRRYVETNFIIRRQVLEPTGRLVSESMIEDVSSLDDARCIYGITTTGNRGIPVQADRQGAGSSVMKMKKTLERSREREKEIHEGVREGEAAGPGSLVIVAVFVRVPILPVYPSPILYTY